MKKTLKNMFFTLIVSCLGSIAAAFIAWFFFGTAYGDPESLSVIVGFWAYAGIFLLCIIFNAVRSSGKGKRRHIKNCT